MLTASILTIIVLPILFITYPMVAFYFMPKSTKSSKKIEVIGHRGNKAKFPENTLTAFENTIASGINMVETDVHLSMDDSLIIMHDADVSRTTNGEGEISDLKYDKIKMLNAGSWFDDGFSNERVPTLSNVLKRINGKAVLLLELKWPKKGSYHNFAQKVVDEIKKHKAEKWVIVQSFEESYIKYITRNHPEIACHQLLLLHSDALPIYINNKIHFKFFKPIPGVQSVNLFYPYCTKQFVERMHSQGIKTIAFTVNSTNTTARLQNNNIDGVISDNPIAISNFLLNCNQSTQ